MVPHGHSCSRTSQAHSPLPGSAAWGSSTGKEIAWPVWPVDRASKPENPATQSSGGETEAEEGEAGVPSGTQPEGRWLMHPAACRPKYRTGREPSSQQEHVPLSTSHLQNIRLGGQRGGYGDHLK